MLQEITEIGILQHETRSFCFGLNSGKRLWSLSASSAEVRDQWINVLRTYQPKSLEAGSRVPHTTIGSIKKTFMKRGKGDPGTDAAPTSSNSAAPSSSSAPNSAASPTSNPTSPRSTPAQGTAATSPPSSPTNSVKVPEAPGSSPAPSHPQRIVSGVGIPPNPSSSPSSMTLASSPASIGMTRATTQIISNEPRVTLIIPSTYALWNPKLAWTPTPERPAWCFELASNLAPELSAWLSPLLSAATRFNMGWAFMMDWVRRIGNPLYSNGTILESIKSGMAKLSPCWTEFDKALLIAEAWDHTHNAVAKLRNQMSELRGLVDAKAAGWYVQLSEKSGEDMEFTYRREETRTPERPAWFFTPTDVAKVTIVADAFKILERAANSFNDHWQTAYEAGKSISLTNKQAAPAVRETILKALTALEPTWKEFEAAISAFDTWNSVSLYTLEVKQHISSLRRLFDSHKRDWLAHLDARTSFVPSNRCDYVFEQDRPSSAERPAWVFKFNLQTPSEISRGLLVLSTAANVFNSNWAIAFDWANKIGKNLATRSVIREGILTAFKDLELCWPNFENAIMMLEPWETAATDVIRQVSQLRGLVEESKEAWLGRLASSQEIKKGVPGLNTLSELDKFRLSGYGSEPSFAGSESPYFDSSRQPSFSGAPSSPSSSSGVVSTAGSFSGPTGGVDVVGTLDIGALNIGVGSSAPNTPMSASAGSTTDTRSIYENALAASREAASIAEAPDAKLAFVPGLGPGSFRNVDIYHAVLKELYRAQQIADIQPELLEKVRALIVETQQRHQTLCFKWALHFAREGSMSRSLEYYEALHEVLPDACVELDHELMLLKAEFNGESRAVSLASK